MSTINKENKVEDRDKTDKALRVLRNIRVQKKRRVSMKIDFKHGVVTEFRVIEEF